MDRKEQIGKEDVVEIVFIEKRDRVQRMMELCQTDIPSSAVKMMAHLALGMIGSYGMNVCQNPASVNQTPAFGHDDDDDRHAITREELDVWMKNRASLTGNGIVDQKMSDDFWDFIVASKFMNGQRKPITFGNVFRTFKSWKGIRDREDRHFQMKLDDAEKRRQREEDESFAVNAIYRRDLIDD